MKNIRINGWDERDYRLWSGIQSLPSYGLVAGRADNPIIARKDVEKLLEQAANKRFDESHTAHPSSRDGQRYKVTKHEDGGAMGTHSREPRDGH